jgi:kynurenine formamidase
MRFVDLSVPLADDTAYAPRLLRTKVRHQSHRYGAFAIRLLFRLPSSYLRTGLGWANEQLLLSTHGTTHVDAPWHYAPTSEGKRAQTIDELPLAWFYGAGVVLDLTALPEGAAASVDDLERALATAAHELAPGDIVLCRFDGDRRLGSRAYFSEGTGVSAAATRWLLDRGVRVVGTDCWGWDAPLARQAARAKREGLRDHFWQAHYVGVEKPYCQLERLANLRDLPPTGFTVCCFPLKVERGSAGPARVVAILED